MSDIEPVTEAEIEEAAQELADQEAAAQAAFEDANAAEIAEAKAAAMKRARAKTLSPDLDPRHPDVRAREGRMLKVPRPPADES